MSVFVHPNALVETDDIGENTSIWAFVHVLKGARIGSNCNICDHCYIEYGVVLGNHVTVKSGTFIWEGVTVEDHVFLGPNVVFTNDVRPRSKQYITPARTLIRHGASLRANSTVLAGVTVGRYAMTGIGSVITRDIPDHALVYGNPARRRGWVDEQGEKLKSAGDGRWFNDEGRFFVEAPEGLRAVE
jgi:acetyltransferase-like isoleucine patch superfamily enzyme